MKLKKYFLISLLLVSLITKGQTKLYTEKYRPQFHFSPATNWCNDPNGLVYNNGTYHLFYQHNPFGNVWGHMTWGHATSTDLLHWKHLPIAIPEEKDTMIFSGTCVVDKNNTSGFGKAGKVPMVAVYTAHIENVNQSQHIAYSLDAGVTWTKYNSNPVLDLHKKDFRDPKIFWHEGKKYWVMALMLPVEHMVQFYSSPNLREWKHLSNFGPVGDTSDVWECPDLTPVPVEGMPGKKKWLLQTSQNASMQYFVGEFDGVSFKNENKPTEILRPDYGPDYYAAIAYNQLPATVLPTAIGWVNNWNYANDIPTTPWKSAMSLPRNLSVKKINNNWILMQRPVPAVNALRKQFINLGAEVVAANKLLPVKSSQFEMELSIEPASTSICGIKLAKAGDDFFEIGYDAAKQLFYVDRSKTGYISFNENFKKLNRFEKSIALKNKKLQLHIYFDNSIVEIFINGGEAVFTTQVFSNETHNGIELFNTGSKSKFSNMNFWEIKTTW
ncbi:glycoside hydrolase family 32 protein [Ferruginibacter sp.]|nr:glycoside hydrolase family 32 protein [Ferruginibacter sp.]